MDDILSEFLTETAENLETIDTELVRFEQDPTDAGTLNNIFRLVHTIKGTCGFLGLPRLEAVAHAGETLLGRFRDGTLEVSPEAVTAVLESIDRIKEILADLESTGEEPAGDDTALIKALEAASEGKSGAPAAPKEEEKVGPNGEKWDADQGRFLRLGEVSLADLEAAFMMADGPEEAQAESAAPAPAAAPATPVRAARGDDGDDDEKGGAASIASQSIRVNVDVLEQLMTMVSELVLTRNQLLQMVRNMENSEFKVPLQRLSTITAELQDRVMKTRMQPIGNAWKKLPRIVRDASRDLGKKIELRMEGEATELDRQVSELIRDPLTHMIRNSCDHAIEKPEDRAARGKSEMGVITLKAYHEGGHIIIQIADDGAGLNTARIRDKAIGKGLITASEAATMTDAQIQRFIFAPGFSTAAAVTNMSGRGVGMDVVKTNVELIGGQIDLVSTEGFGTVFTIKIPLTLAIVSAMIVGSRGGRFAIPQISVLELVRAGQNSDNRIERVNDTRVMRLRDKLLPLVDIADVLELGERPATDTAPTGKEPEYVVVMQAGGQRFGLVVDEVLDTEEIVVKPLSTLLKEIATFSGSTILGDGSVILIVDPNGVARHVGELGQQSENADEDASAGASSGRSAISMLLFEAGGPEPKAVPLSLVTRLEDTQLGQIERANGRIVMQYRGQLVPVIHPAGDYAFKTEGTQQILVFTQGQKTMGIAVDRIVDIVHDRMDIELVAHTPGILGAAVIKGRATEVIDVGHFLQMAHDDWFDATSQEAPPSRRLLLVETNAFFRNLLSPLLQAAGYDVTAVENTEAAWRLHARGEAFDAILADVEGDPGAAETFATRVSEDPRWSNVARLALTGGQQSAAGGFTDAVKKSDRHGLLAALDYALKNRGDAA
jgi:two-component system, chemotaxis family, sensor kinase CheA